MRLAVIADVHGNDLALEAVLADIERLGIREIVNLGDTVSGILNAARTADILMARNIPTVRGNHDRWLVEKHPDSMGAWDRPAHAELQAHHLNWLAALPATLTLPPGLLLCHANPRDDTTYWLHQPADDGSMRLAAQAHVEALATGATANLLLCGHTHIPGLVTLADGRKVLNPGSVGCQAYRDDEPVSHIVETGSPEARYAVITHGDAGLDVTFRLVPYDHLAQARLTERRGDPEWAEALAAGRLA
ncbi:metallophosphoesterase family protein [Rhizobium sp. SG2393]|uniref:metallophosphoesterase family protein n=1 Tax=Rhizobium sp. SG2393 TaxID=3276279 RepID=UPI00366B4E55